MSTQAYMEDDVPKLPSEIICLEILPRLPAKSLMRFRCVCKSWLELFTSNPLFQSIHLKYHPHNTHLLLDIIDFCPFPADGGRYFLFVKASQEESTLSQATDCVEVPKNFSYMYSANGLLLGYSGQYGAPVFIFNPFTRKSISIPYPAGPNIRWRSSWYEKKYFGFSPRTNEYKIILAQIFQQKNVDHMEDKFMLKVFTLGTGLWRTLEVDWDALSLDPLKCWSFHRTDSVCVNGAIHWLTSNEDCILALDVADERFTVIPLPRVEADDRLQMIEVDGCLTLACDWKQQKMVLWILKDYEIWVKETIDSLPPGYPNVSSPRCTIHTGEILFDSTSPAKPDYDLLRLYGMKTKTYRSCRIKLPELICHPFFCPFSTSFSPCTVPLT